MGPDCIRLKIFQAYQSIVTMESSLQRREKALKNRGIPGRALILSAALHVLLLGSIAPRLDAPAGATGPAEPLHATLRSVPSVATPAPRPAVAAPSAPSLRTADVAARRTEAPAQEGPDPAPVAVRADDEVISGSLAGTKVTGVIAATPAGGEPAPAMAAPIGRDGPDAAGLRQYRLALAGEARRFRRYPEEARRAGIAGTAEVRVTVAAAGVPRHAELAKSSGHAALDAAALEMLDRAAAHARLPASLEGRGFAVLLPVVFEVQD